MSDHSEPTLAIQGGVAMCRQIQAQIRDYIVAGQLRPGEELPTVRAMAVELAVNPGLVCRAYEALEHEGFLTSEEGSGVFVAPLPTAWSQRAAYQIEFERLCHEFLAQAARYGYSSEDALGAIEALTERRLSS
jgi:GntR family transcriptional regulator